MPTKKKPSSSRAEETRLACRHHRPIRDFLNSEDIREKLLDEVKEGNKLTLLIELLRKKDPVTKQHLEKTLRMDVAVASRAAGDLIEDLHRFSKQFKSLKRRKIVITIYRSLGGTKVGYYFTCQNKKTEEYLPASKIKEIFINLWIGEITDSLRMRIRSEARDHLSKKLRKRDDYQPLEMELGSIEEIPLLPEFDIAFEVQKARQIESARVWRTFDSKFLLDPRALYILSSDVGTGKTTFLRHLQLRILKKKKRIPIFFYAKDIENWNFKDTDTFLMDLAEKLKAWLPEKNAFKFFKAIFATRIVLLIDGLDQITGVGTEYENVLYNILKVCVDNLIVASRPSAVISQEMNSNVAFLRLKPFNKDVREEYYGQHYQRVCELCERDPSMLGIPMLAYMVRELIEKGRDQNITNRALLYERFVDYVLEEYDHEESKLAEGERAHVRQLLQEISYKALANKEPFVQKVPLRNCCQFIDEYEKIDRLTKYGLVNLIVNTSEETEKCLYFTHQSFQEYLAAEYASQSKDRINYLVDNYWDPKWHEVIKFLVGIKGESLIKRIYRGPNHDNVIHSRLFFATESVGETKISENFENHLVSACASLVDEVPFDIDAVRAMVKMKTKRGWDKAWKAVLDKTKDGKIHNFFQEHDIIRPLFSERGFKAALMALYNGDGAGEYFLRAWSSAISKKEIPNIIKMVGRVGGIYAGAGIIESLSSRLRDDDITQIVKKLSDSDYRIRRAAILALRPFGRRLTKQQIDKSVSTLNDPQYWVAQTAAQFISQYIPAQKFSRSHIKKILNSYWNFFGPIRQYLVDGSFKVRFGTAEISEIFEKLESTDIEQRSSAMLMLKGLGDRLTKGQIQKIMNYLDDPLLIENAILAAATMRAQLTSKQAKEIISKLYSEDAKTRAAVISSIKFLYKDIQKSDIKAIILSEDDDIISKLRACLYVVDSLESDDIWLILDRLVSTEISDIRLFNLENVAGKFATHLNEEQNSFLIQKISSANILNAANLLHFLNIRKFSEADAQLFINMIKSIGFPVLCRRLFYRLLCELHELGNLE